MKLGFIQVYNEVNWIGYAIDQAMMLCDEALIMEGSQYANFLDIPKRSDDGTLDVISDKEKEYPGRIKMARTTRRHDNYRFNLCDNLNYGLSLCNRGDYLLWLDADEYCSDHWIKEANAMMRENKVEVIDADVDSFAFSFKWRIDFDEADRASYVLKKVDGLRFAPTARPINAGKRVEVISGENVHFHYTWVKSAARMFIRMRTSMRYPSMVAWFLDNWHKIELVEGVTYPSYNRSFTLHRYDGEHPSVLDNHPWRHVEDIRRFDQ